MSSQLDNPSAVLLNYFKNKAHSELFVSWIVFEPHGTMRCSILFYDIFLPLWSEGNPSIGDIALGFIPKIGLFGVYFETHTGLIICQWNLLAHSERAITRARLYPSCLSIFCVGLRLIGNFFTPLIFFFFFFFGLYSCWDNDVKEESTTQSHHPRRLRVSDAKPGGLL